MGMNAAEMVYHSLHHQRHQPSVARCPICHLEMYWNLFWECADHKTVTTPTWDYYDDATCPYEGLHV